MTPMHEDLLASLHSYVPSTPEEQGHREQIVGLVESKLSAFASDEYRPGHITASAFVLHPSLPQVVLVHHRKLSRWLQPGGHVESADIDMVAASRREVAEETGLVELDDLGLVDLDVHVFPQRGSVPRHLHLDVRRGFRSKSARLVVSEESTDVRWTPLAELLEMEESLARPARALSARIAAGTLRAH